MATGVVSGRGFVSGRVLTAGVGLGAIAALLLAGCTSTVKPSPGSPSVVPSTESSSPATDASTSIGSPTSSGPSSPSQTSSSSEATPTANATSGGSDDVQTCQTRQLTLTQGRIDGTAGSDFVTYFLQNRGPNTCSMVGYPGFSLLFADGSIIQRPAARNGFPYHTIRLEPGERGQFVVQTVHAAINGTGCSTSWKTAEVQVYPPNQRVAIRQPSKVPACDLRVGPMTRA